MIPANASKQFISSHGLLSGVLRAAIFLGLLCFAAHARAEEDATAVIATDATELPSCVFQDLKVGESCPAFSTARALEFLGMGEEAIIFIEKDAPTLTTAKPGGTSESKFLKKPERTSVLASSRIEDSVLLEQIDEDDAMLLEREVQELSGARYELPRTRSEIKKLLGFPESAEVADDDWVEMIRVHAEMTLSLSENVSRFLLEQLGLTASATFASSASTALPAPAEDLNPAVVETH